MKPTDEQIMQWARTVKPGEFRAGWPVYRELAEMAELAFAAGMEAAAQVCDMEPGIDSAFCAQAIRKAKEES